MSKHEIILTDCDGVLLDWETAFDEWIQSKGYMKVPNHDVTAYGLHVHYGIPKKEVQKLIRQFNESAAIGFIKPMREAEKWLPLLANHGYRFVVITSVSNDPYAAMAREHNLKSVFGDIFEEIICLDTGADKDKELEKWKNGKYYFVEDKLENAIVGLRMGLRSILMMHNHNNHCNITDIIKVQNWKEISQIILESSNDHF